MSGPKTLRCVEPRPTDTRPPGTAGLGRPRQVWLLAAARSPDGYKMITEAAVGDGDGDGEGMIGSNSG